MATSQCYRNANPGTFPGTIGYTLNTNVSLTPTLLYPKNIESKIGFNAIKRYLKDECSSSLGTTHVDRLTFSDSFDQISKLLHQTEEFRRILTGEGSFPSAHFLDVTTSLNSAKTPGAFLSEEEFHNIQLSLTTLFQCLRFFQKDAEEDAYPYLKELSGAVQLPVSLLNGIKQVIDEQGQVRNNASAELKQIRRALLSEQSRLRKVLDQILRNAQGQGFTPDDASVTIRGGRMVIPVLAEYKRRVKGFIHDESATGQTVFLEPAEVLEINNEIRDLTYREKREVVRILTTLTDTLRPHLPNLRTAYQFLGMIDFIRAKARLALRLDARCPKLVKERVLDWVKARHPLLQLSETHQNRSVVPLDIALNSDQRILVISGPNAGGKSVCLKTVALLQYMVQCGLLIPLAEQSTVGLFQSVFIDIGDEQSLENDLSTYSSHLTSMNYFVKFADKKTLVLIDEFGTGTEPQFGGAIAEAILEDLNAKRVFGVITTHYSNLKEFADRAEGVVNGAMRYDTLRLEPLFALEIGKPGSSFALEIARKIGLHPDVLERAKEKVGVDQVEYEKMLVDLEAERTRYQELTQSLAAKEKRISQTAQEYEELRDHVKGEKKDILNRAKHEAKQILQEANQTIENTIRTIKEQNAEKEATRQARRALEEKKVHLKPDRPVRKPQTIPEDEVVGGEISVGDAVRVKDNNAIGEVLSMRGQQVEVRIGALKSIIKRNRLDKVSSRTLKRTQNAAERPAQRYDMHEKFTNFSPRLDVRGQRAEEVIPRLMGFVDEAAMVGSDELRVVHGKGTGALREAVRNYLRTHERVAATYDEHVERGGAGVTIVRMK